MQYTIPIYYIALLYLMFPSLIYSSAKRYCLLKRSSLSSICSSLAQTAEKQYCLEVVGLVTSAANFTYVAGECLLQMSFLLLLLQNILFIHVERSYQLYLLVCLLRFQMKIKFYFMLGMHDFLKKLKNGSLCVEIKCSQFTICNCSLAQFVMLHCS